MFVGMAIPEFAQRVLDQYRLPDTPQVFISLPGGHAIVDPGAGQDLIGQQASLQVLVAKPRLCRISEACFSPASTSRMFSSREPAGPSPWSWNQERPDGLRDEWQEAWERRRSSQAPGPGQGEWQDRQWGEGHRQWDWGDQWGWREDWWSAASRGKDYADPPAWAGWPNYRLWKRSIQRWDQSTDVSVNRRAERTVLVATLMNSSTVSSDLVPSCPPALP